MQILVENSGYGDKDSVAVRKKSSQKRRTTAGEQAVSYLNSFFFLLNIWSAVGPFSVSPVSEKASTSKKSFASQQVKAGSFALNYWLGFHLPVFMLIWLMEMPKFGQKKKNCSLEVDFDLCEKQAATGINMCRPVRRPKIFHGKNIKEIARHNPNINFLSSSTTTITFYVSSLSPLLFFYV